MIDRGEYAEDKQRDGEHRQRRRERRGDERHAAAKEERDHHVAAAPAVGKPTRRQREKPERDEGGGRKRDQFRIAAAVGELEFDDYGRINQDDEMIERMRPIEEADAKPPPRQANRSGGGKLVGS